MSRTSAVRVVAAIVAGLAGGFAAWRGLAPIEPFLETSARLDVRMEGYENWTVVVRVRGGETIDEVRVEPKSGPVRVVSPARRLPAGVTTNFHVQVEGGHVAGAAVRVVQSGRVARAYDVPLEETRP